jgi:hypothetical protein
MGYKNFREVYHKLAIVLDNGYCYNTLCMPENTKPDLPMEVNSALVYGYIDKTCGFSYKVLGLTYYEDGDYTLVWPNDEIGFTVRGECFKAFDFIPIENKAIYKRYEPMIESTNECYSNANDEKTRSFEMLDPFRHEDYPDDVLVLIINHQYRKQEQIWVTLKKYTGTEDNIRVFTAKLLDEPFNDIYGMNRNDEILVGYITAEDGDSFLLGLPKN